MARQYSTKKFLRQAPNKLLGRYLQERGGYLRFIRQYVEQIPIPDAWEADRAVISALVQKCLEAEGIGCEAWEREIDERVAELYGL